MKIDKKLLLITSLLTLLPLLLGFILWNQLPEQVATHFGINGKADGYSGKAFAVCFMPLFMLVMHLFVIFTTSLDPKARKIGKMYKLTYWIIPAISIWVQSAVLLNAAKIISFSGSSVLCLLGVLFLIIGNYLPKIGQNYTVGIKLPWTLNDEDNWKQTHRFASKIWVLGGLLLIISGLFNIYPVVFLVLDFTIMILVPTIYSYMIYKKKLDRDKK
ncbi:SdpI family protein [Streptococcus hongkongensis]|nr:hemolysin expression modulating protein [Streptococcus uberis]